ncbi:MAG: hypothetical protein IJ375_02345 [Oscillospiraceae bacterium]|nr:hypothetical protein [Oscillospiraceae bacterium]
MTGRRHVLTLVFAAALLLGGCALRTVDQMYSLPKRSQEYNDLQAAIDASMGSLDYCAPLSGENQQTVQMADLDGDGVEEYLLFAKGSSDKPLQILVFDQQDGNCYLREIIESRGSAFELIEYVDIDGQPGLEMVVGRQVSDQVPRALTAYTFSGGGAQQLLAVSYSKFVTADLDEDGRIELMVIAPGESESDNAVASLYSYRDGAMNRSAEANLSETADHIKRIMVSCLEGGTPAVYVASAVEESAIITDVFALKDGRFTNVSFSNESGTSVQTLRNYYVYADDIDDDGVLELPSLITMASRDRSAATHYLIRWYAMTPDGEEVDKMYTFHNFDGGWYVRLDGHWASRIMVTQEGSTFSFCLWDEAFQNYEKLMTVFALTGSGRDEAAVEDNRFVLYKADGVVYAAKLEAAAVSWDITQERLTESFHLIHQDWKTGETE